MADSRDSLPNPNAFDQYMRSNESDIFGDLLDDPAVDVDDHVWRDERLGHGPHNRGFPVSSSAPAIDSPTFDAHITDIPHRHPIESDSSDFTFAISQWPDSTLPELDSTLAASYGTVPLSADNVAHSLPASAAVPQTQPVQQVLANDLLLFPDFDATGTQTNDPIYWPVPTLPFLPTDYIALDEMALDSHLGFQENFSIRGPQPSLPTSLPWIADVSPALLPTFPTNAILPLTIPNALEPFNQSATSANEDRSQPLFPLDVIDSLQSRPYPETIPVEPPVHVAPAALQLRTEPEIEDYFEGPSGLAIYPESTGDGLLSQRPLGLEDPPFEVYSPRTIATFRREVESIISGSSVPSIPPGAPHGGAYITSEDDTQIELIPSSSRRDTAGDILYPIEKAGINVPGPAFIGPLQPEKTYQSKFRVRSSITKPSDSSNETETKPKRRRRKFKEIEKGNNDYGKFGTQKCERCRIMRRKCEYSNPWAPCNHCKTHDVEYLCLKVRGAKADPSRQLPTPIDAVIPHEEVLLLHYLYDKGGLEADFGDCLFANFLRKLGAFFEPSIPLSPFLRSAMLLLAEVLTERDQWQDFTDSHPDIFGLDISDIVVSCVIGRMGTTEPETFENLLPRINSVLPGVHKIYSNGRLVRLMIDFMQISFSFDRSSIHVVRSVSSPNPVSPSALKNGSLPP